VTADTAELATEVARRVVERTAAAGDRSAWSAHRRASSWKVHAAPTSISKDGPHHVAMSDVATRVSRARVWVKALAPVFSGLAVVALLIWGNSRSWVFDRDRSSGGVDACALLTRAQAEDVLGLPLTFAPRHGRDTVDGAVIGTDVDGGRTYLSVDSRAVEVTERSRCTYIALVPGESAVPARALIVTAQLDDPAVITSRYAHTASELGTAAAVAGQEPPAITPLAGVGVKAQVVHWRDQMRSTSVLAMDQRALVSIDSVGVGETALADAARIAVTTAARIAAVS